MLKSESITKVSAALLKAQSVMTAALKDSKNPFFKSSYADLNSVLDASRPALNENGISVVQSTSSRMNEQGVRIQVLETILLHESGEYIGSETDIVVKPNGNAQDYGSAISYARRYGLQALVALKGEDDDGNKASGKVNPQAGSISVTELAQIKKDKTIQEVLVGTGPVVSKQTSQLEENLKKSEEATPAPKGFRQRKTTSATTQEDSF